jgi:antitoxin HicB
MGALLHGRTEISYPSDHDRRRAAAPTAAARHYPSGSRVGSAITQSHYSYPIRLEPDEDGRLVVHFPDLPEALTDGGDLEAALIEAADCLSTALAARIAENEQIPPPSRRRKGQHLVAPAPRIALKAALDNALRARGITVADLARRIGIEERQAARLINPRAASKLTDLEAALSALGYTIAIEVYEKPAA